VEPAAGRSGSPELGSQRHWRSGGGGAGEGVGPWVTDADAEVGEHRGTGGVLREVTAGPGMVGNMPSTVRHPGNNE
jgi:hypothetical protein